MLDGFAVRSLRGEVMQVENSAQLQCVVGSYSSYTRNTRVLEGNCTLVIANGRSEARLSGGRHTC